MVSHSTQNKAAIALGANLGDIFSTFSWTLTQLQTQHKILAKSGVYRTKAEGPPQPDFLNAAVLIETTFPPKQLLDWLLLIEIKAGRKRISNEISPRPLDLDLIFYENLCINNVFLSIPHPRMHQRRFVLLPLSEVAPQWIHPKQNASVLSLLEALGPASEDDAQRVGFLGNS